MKKLIGYVVMERGFEYNDEINSESEGGTPKKIIFNKDDANKEVKRLNIEKLKSTSITDYTYDIEDVLSVDVEEFEKLLESINESHGGKEKPKYQWQDDTYSIHPKATDEELEKVYKAISLRFYECVEVEVDRESFRDTQIDSVLS